MILFNFRFRSQNTGTSASPKKNIKSRRITRASSRRIPKCQTPTTNNLINSVHLHLVLLKIIVSIIVSGADRGKLSLKNAISQNPSIKFIPNTSPLRSANRNLKYVSVRNFTKEIFLMSFLVDTFQLHSTYTQFIRKDRFLLHLH